MNVYQLNSENVVAGLRFRKSSFDWKNFGKSSGTPSVNCVTFGRVLWAEDRGTEFVVSVKYDDGTYNTFYNDSFLSQGFQWGDDLFEGLGQ